MAQLGERCARIIFPCFHSRARGRLSLRIPHSLSSFSSEETWAVEAVPWRRGSSCGITLRWTKTTRCARTRNALLTTRSCADGHHSLDFLSPITKNVFFPSVYFVCVHLVAPAHLPRPSSSTPPSHLIFVRVEKAGGSSQAARTSGAQRVARSVGEGRRRPRYLRVVRFIRVALEKMLFLSFCKKKNTLSPSNLFPPSSLSLSLSLFLSLPARVSTQG